MSKFNTLSAPSDHKTDAEIGRTAVSVLPTGGAFVRIEGGGDFDISNNVIMNLRAGVSIAAGSGAKVRMSGNKTENVSTLVEVTEK
jgi:outer membrane usher protein FimD/PapC